jgi:hypothetical protein
MFRLRQPGNNTMTTRTKASNATAGRSGKSTKTTKTAKGPASGAKSVRSPSTPAKAARATPTDARPPSRLATIVSHLEAPAGASIADLCAATGWQAHSIRGAIAGALKHKGHVVTSSVVDGVRRYKIAAAPR